MQGRHFILCASALAAAFAMQGCSGGLTAGNATPPAGRGDATSATSAPAGNAYPSLPPAPGPAGASSTAAASAPVSASAAPPPAAIAAGGANDAAIEVGCTYVGSQISGPSGTRKLLNCPAGCFDRGWIWGTDHYTNDSTICNAAIHAGVIPAEGGNVIVTREDGRPAYRGSRRNGIESSDYGEFASGFRVQKP